MSVTDQRQLTWFVIVGGGGFFVDALLLQTLITVGLGPIVARLLSFPVAVVFTWLMHRRFTFSSRRSSRRGSELGKYLTSQIVSALLGLAAYTYLVLYHAFFTAWPIVALVISSAIGMLSNYLLSHYLVFTETETG